MTRFALLFAAMLVLTGCPGDDDQPVVDTAAPLADQPVNFDTLTTSLPPAVPDTGSPPPRERPRAQPAAIPQAPPALMDAVEREQSFTLFCYQEHGQKDDPSLRGGVAMVVTVGSGGITDARVANDSWTSSSGKAVNRCLNDKAKDAWRLDGGLVRPGKYVVNLTFSPA